MHRSLTLPLRGVVRARATMARPAGDDNCVIAAVQGGGAGGSGRACRFVAEATAALQIRCRSKRPPAQIRCRSKQALADSLQKQARSLVDPRSNLGPVLYFIVLEQFSSPSALI